MRTSPTYCAPPLSFIVCIRDSFLLRLTTAVSAEEPYIRGKTRELALVDMPKKRKNNSIRDVCFITIFCIARALYHIALLQKQYSPSNTKIIRKLKKDNELQFIFRATRMCNRNQLSPTTISIIFSGFRNSFAMPLNSLAETVFTTSR